MPLAVGAVGTLRDPGPVWGPGTGEVHCAQNALLGRQVAVRVLPAALLTPSPRGARNQLTVGWTQKEVCHA
jgi:hypothetical protein